MAEHAACQYCGTAEKELRPYGPGGTWTCFACATAMPEREAIAHGAYGALLDAAVSMTGVASIGTQDGPQPVLDEELLREVRHG